MTNMQMHERGKPWFAHAKHFTEAGGDGVSTKTVEDVVIYEQRRPNAPTLCVDRIFNDNIPRSEPAGDEARRFDVPNRYPELPSVGDIIQIHATNDCNLGGVAVSRML